MSPAPRPRCSRCFEPVPPGAAICVRCAANPSPPGLPARFAKYDPERPRSPLYHYFNGIRFFLTSLTYVLTTRGVKRHITVPIVLSVVLLVFLIGGTLALATWLAGPAGEGAGAQFGRAIWQIALLVILLVGAYLLFFPLARVLLAPFADKISVRVETLALGEPPPSQFELGAAATDAGRALVEALKMLALQAVVSLPLLVIPVAGPVLAIAAGVFFNGLGTMDIALGRKRLRLGEKLALARRHLGFVLGLGTAVYIVALVPFVNLLAIPLGAVAATTGALRIRAAALPDRAAPPAAARA